MLQVGVDCEEILRFKKLPLDTNEKFYRKIFTPQEIEYCAASRNPYQRFAARFAAKEATIKALNGFAKPSYADIEIKRDRKDKPGVSIDRKRFGKIADLSIVLSLTHSDTLAVAFVVISDDIGLLKKTEPPLKKDIRYVNNRIRSRAPARKSPARFAGER